MNSRPFFLFCALWLVHVKAYLCQLTANQAPRIKAYISDAKLRHRRQPVYLCISVAVEAGMLIEGKFVKPLACYADVHRNALDGKLGSPTLLIEAPSGYLLTGCLAVLLEEAGRQIVWLMLGSEDVDPASCLWSLAMAAQQVDRQAGSETLCRLQRLPGQLQGWSGLLEFLAWDCTDRLTALTTWVFEHAHHLARSPKPLALLGNSFVRLLPANQQMIMTTQELIPLSPMRKPFVQVKLDYIS